VLLRCSGEPGEAENVVQGAHIMNDVQPSEGASRYFRMMRTVSYAQNAEDILLRRVFGDRTSGFYIDVGAADPRADSVTKLFYDQGWSGVNVEPQTTHLADLRRERPRDINLGVALGSEPGEMTLFRPAEIPGRATLAIDVADVYRADGLELEEIRVEVRTLASVCDDFAPDTIDFLKIDVEGGERDVIAGGDWQRHRPVVVVVEMIEPSHPELWEPLLVAAGYTRALFDGINGYFVANEHEQVTEKLRVPANVLDGYDSYIYVDQLAAAGAEIERQRERNRALGETIENVAAQLESATTRLIASRQALWARTEERDRAQQHADALQASLEHCSSVLRERDEQIASVRRRLALPLALARRVRHLGAGEPPRP
jgi:FkbM family methyltransferase